MDKQVDTQFLDECEQYVAAPKCAHWQEPFKIGEMGVTVSGLYAWLLAPYRDKRVWIAPTKVLRFGIYFDGQWRGTRLVLHERVVVDWPDRGVYPVQKVAQLGVLMKAYSDLGYTVDVGCLGGHGRTGTFLACMLVQHEGLTAGRAVAEVRRRHCGRAVETDRQEKMVGEMSRYMKKINRKVKMGK